MRLFSFLFRVAMLLVGALIGLGLFVIAVVGFLAFFIYSLITGRKPDPQFRVNKNPWAGRREPAAAQDIVDIEAREVPEAGRPGEGAPSLPPPRQP